MDFVRFQRLARLCQAAPTIVARTGTGSVDGEAVRCFVNEHITMFTIVPVTDPELAFALSAVDLFRRQLPPRSPGDQWPPVCGS